MAQPAPREDSGAQPDATHALRVRFNLVHDSFQVRAVRNAVMSLAKVQGFDESATSGLALAVGEGLDNAFDHGCPPGERVQVEMSFESEGVTVTIEDPGGLDDDGNLSDAFDDLDLDNLELDEDSFRGRGLFLIRSYMDRVESTALPDGGTRVVMHKRKNS